MPIRVVSKRSGGTKPVPGEMVINIARPSVLGNPFHMRSESQRTQVINDYREWLQNRYGIDQAVTDELHRIAALVKQDRMVAVECWCAPCACHGDVIIAAVNWINNQPE
jgi:hypothetical protein